MPVWRRYLVKEGSGRLVELSSRLYDRADDGTAPLPDFAGRCVELVAAVMVGATGGDARVTEVAFTKLYFDQSGFVDAAKRDQMIRLMLESCADRRCPDGAGSSGRRQIGRAGCVADCASLTRRADAARHELMRVFGWKPAPAELDAVFHVLDGHAQDRGAPGSRPVTKGEVAAPPRRYGGPTLH